MDGDSVENHINRKYDVNLLIYLKITEIFNTHYHPI